MCPTDVAKDFFFSLMLDHTSDFRDAKLPRCALFGISENIRGSDVRFPRKSHTFVISLAFGFCVFGLRMFSDLFFDKYTAYYNMKLSYETLHVVSTYKEIQNKNMSKVNRKY